MVSARQLARELFFASCASWTTCSMENVLRLRSRSRRAVETTVRRNTEVTGPEATKWIASVETCLKKYLHASFATRFKTNYASGGQARRDYPYLPEMQMKVEKLEEFLVELDD